MVAMAQEDEARTFRVLTDGTVRGDDGADGRLAVSVRYAARLATQVEFVLDVGALREVSTVSSRALTATVTRDDAGEVGLAVRVQAAEHRQPKVLTVVGGADVHAALAHCVHRVQQVPDVRWAAIAARDKRVVGASLPRAGAAVLESVSALPNVAVRALAVLEAIDEPLRESWVELVYERATVVVAALDAGCVFAVVDAVRAQPFGEALDEVRAVLAPYDLVDATALATGADPVDEARPEPEANPAVVPAQAGMRYRAAGPRAPREGRRGFFRG